MIMSRSLPSWAQRTTLYGEEHGPVGEAREARSAAAALLQDRRLAPAGLEDLGDDGGGVEAGCRIHALGLVLVDEAVGQHHGAHFQAAVEHAALGQELQHEAAEAAD